jgi:hypothetical protein
VFRDHDKLRNKSAFVERVQLSGLCYMHAPIVLQHYLVSMNTDEKVKMLDMGRYLREHMSGEALYLHIWNDFGGSSAGFLRQILVQQPAPPVVSAISMKASEWIDALKQYGPLLVSSVKVDATLHDKVTTTFDGVRGEAHGHHAMVLVGHRKQGDVDLFLLQNWWNYMVWCAHCLFR